MPRRFSNILLALLLVAASATIRAAEETALLTIQPASGAPITLTREQWSALPRLTVTAAEHGGESATFEGVPVAEVLRLAAAPLGKDMRGDSLRYYVIAHASDGYAVVFALTEFDPAFTDRVILIADRRNGEALGTNDGPLRFVVPGDKRQARWIRHLFSLAVRIAP